MNYTITTAPKHAEFYEQTCAICGHEELAKPIYLLTPTGNVIAAGSGCAAVALYGEQARHNRSAAVKVRRQFDLVAHEARQQTAAAADRAANYRLALAAFNDDRHTAGLQEARRTFHSLRPSMTFPEFLAAVAETGTLPA